MVSKRRHRGGRSRTDSVRLGALLGSRRDLVHLALAGFVAGDLVYLAPVGFVAWGRFGPESFTG
ncbi:hypothetical protein GA0070624_0610 [Micromonospora rhizosphaerae]|uniref:Uncharacterized protein n=1 Tax=Micromonospora rhizosphaerae TaxID=568872 RepID=A0A1C6RDA5_9ACTN|nr:hypothetical protein GA0070624_0610 [Micromonospora rhizosphaerae]